MKFDRNKLYVVDGIALEAFESIMNRLYSDNKPFAPGELRDIANKMDAHLTQHVDEYKV